MENPIKQKFLSICIPTRNREAILIETLESIYANESNHECFEVVIYDSGDTDYLSKVIQSKYSRVSNLTYRKGPNAGFLNLISALEIGDGMYLKLHNDYSSFKFGSVQIMIDQIAAKSTEKPLIVFSDDSFKSSKTSFTSFDSFFTELSFFSTWSTLFGMWKSDFDLVKTMPLNKMFPHTSLLYNSAPSKNSFLINNKKLFEHTEIPGKGGYNLFEVFAVQYLTMNKELCDQGMISIRTFNKIKDEMLISFFANWYYLTKLSKNNYTFILENIKTSMLVYYTPSEYYKMLLMAYVKSAFNLLKKLKL